MVAGPRNNLQANSLGLRLIVCSTASEPMAESDEVFVSVEPRHCVLLEE